MTWRRNMSCCTPCPVALTQCFPPPGKGTVGKMNPEWAEPQHLAWHTGSVWRVYGRTMSDRKLTMLSVKYRRQKRASLFPTLVSYSSQLSRRMLVCVWVKQLRRAFIVRVSDCVRSVGAKCLQSQHSRWTYTRCNLELVRVWLHVTETVTLSECACTRTKDEHKCAREAAKRLCSAVSADISRRHQMAG